MVAPLHTAIMAAKQTLRRLAGTTGVNVTLLTYNTTCEGLGPETRISGDGTFSGEGLFVGVSQSPSLGNTCGLH